MKMLDKKEIEQLGNLIGEPLKDGAVAIEVKGTGKLFSVSGSIARADWLQDKINDGKYNCNIAITADEARALIHLDEGQRLQFIRDTEAVKKYLDPRCRIHAIRVKK
tara:strand:- start:15 stop:335 length:321 start_codon:yes stop_codon:yes gene_type:complete